MRTSYFVWCIQWRPCKVLFLGSNYDKNTKRSQKQKNKNDRDVCPDELRHYMPYRHAPGNSVLHEVIYDIDIQFSLYGNTISFFFFLCDIAKRFFFCDIAKLVQKNFCNNYDVQ